MWADGVLVVTAASVGVVRLRAANPDPSGTSPGTGKRPSRTGGARVSRNRPILSYANVAATIALVLSMTSGALAASHYLVNSTKQINPKVLKKLRTPGARGPAGLTGPQGTQGLPGINGTAGVAGSAVAYARVAANGTLDVKHSKNIASAKLSFTTGVYCITPTVNVQSAIVSVPHVAADTGEFSQASISANGDSETGSCESPAWVSIRNASGVNEDHPFYIVFN
jgi:hypothetical protein